MYITVHHSTSRHLQVMFEYDTRRDGIASAGSGDVSGALQVALCGPTLDMVQLPWVRLSCAHLGHQNPHTAARNRVLKQASYILELSATAILWRKELGRRRSSHLLRRRMDENLHQAAATVMAVVVHTLAVIVVEALQSMNPGKPQVGSRLVPPISPHIAHQLMH